MNNIVLQVVFMIQDGRTPLMAALFSKNFEMVRLLVEMGADVNRADKVRRTGEGNVLQ